MQTPLRFILIDDEVCSNKITKAFITKVYLGVEIVDFLSPVEGLAYITNELAAHLVSSVIFLDINMPVLDGWQVLEKLEELPLHIKEYLFVFMLSSSIDPKDKQKAMNHPLVVGYIEKPLSKERLVHLFD